MNRAIRRIGSRVGVCALLVAALVAVDTLPLSLNSMPTEIAEDLGDSRPSAKPAPIVCSNMACSTGDPSIPCCCTDEDSQPTTPHGVSSMSPCADMGDSTGVAVLVLSSRDLPDRALLTTSIERASASVARRIGNVTSGALDLPDRVPIV